MQKGPIWEDVPPSYRLLTKSLALTLGLLLLAGMLSAIFQKYNTPFLPSPDWAKKTERPIYFIATLIAVLFFVAFRRGSSQEKPFSFRRVMAVVFTPLFAWVIAESFCRLTVPQVASLVAGRTVSFEYTVRRAEGFSDRKCYREIELSEMPFLMSSLCRFPDSFRNSLRPGSRILVEGYGTEMGLFVKSARLEKY